MCSKQINFERKKAFIEVFQSTIRYVGADIDTWGVTGGYKYHCVTESLQSASVKSFSDL